METPSYKPKPSGILFANSTETMPVSRLLGILDRIGATLPTDNEALNTIINNPDAFTAYITHEDGQWAILFMEGVVDIKPENWCVKIGNICDTYGSEISASMTIEIKNMPRTPNALGEPIDMDEFFEALEGWIEEDNDDTISPEEDAIDTAALKSFWGEFITHQTEPEIEE